MMRFPNWYYCPTCGRLYFFPIGALNVHTCTDPKCKKSRLVPERFIVICPNGHIDNLPILEMLHHDDPDFDEQRWMNDENYRKNKHNVFRKTGTTTSLSGIKYECSCGKSINLGGVFKEGSLAKFGINHCSGARPWLGETLEAHEKCQCSAKDLHVVQRGGTNVWFPLIVSSIYVPPKANDNADAKIIQILEKEKHRIEQAGSEEGGVPIENLKHCAWKYKVDEKVLIEAYKNRYFNAEDPSPIAEDATTDEAYRFEEFNAIKNDYGNDRDELFVKASNIENYQDVLKATKRFVSVSLVKKMKETRALVGFSRVNPANIDFKDIELNRKQLSLSHNINWLPAIQNSGEGIFIRFDDKSIEEWSALPEVKKRIEKLNKRISESNSPIRSRGPVTASFVMIHTFSHLLINELSKVCGYGSSSIRERLYVSDNPSHLMHGILLYTASSGSEGSLGGLVRLGQTGYLETLVHQTIQDALWCSSDPICINSLGQGPDSLNLAACHNCALLPETCCENGNKLLDRGLLIGNPFDSHSEYGYFHDLIQKL
ncbi:MAG: DUF1998 domain-containing protein, partial [Bacilli bacterium]